MSAIFSIKERHLGWFQDGFSQPAGHPRTCRCGQHHTGLTADDGVNAEAYIPHYEPFMYYQQTTNRTIYTQHQFLSPH
jgi:hypothetical protein